jgi:hypothetical protein
MDVNQLANGVLAALSLLLIMTFSTRRTTLKEVLE